MILIRANHDIQTSYLYSFSESIIDEAESKGFRVAQVEGDDISENTLRSRIKNRTPRFIVFYGHGSQTALFDNKKKEFINIESADVFKGTISYAIACDCLSRLGVEAVKKGCKAFVGYHKPFWIARDNSFESRPLKDQVARPIIECSNTVVRSLIKGNTVNESIRKSHEKAAAAINKLVYSSEPLAIASLKALMINDSSLGFKGDGSSIV